MNTIAELFEQGLQFHQSSDLARAEPIYRQVLQADPGHADVHHMLGVLALQTGHSEEAGRFISQAIALQPSNPNYHFSLGSLWQNQGQQKLAVECYRQALRLNPQMLEALVNLGGVLREQGQLAEAVSCFRQALSIQPHHAGLLSNLGVTLRALGQLADAVTCYRQALQWEPNNANVLDNLAMALRDQGSLAEAAECCRQALRINPVHPQANNSLGLILQDMGKAEEALECYRQALQIDPRNARAHHNLGTALLKLGRPAEACACFRQALSIQPQYALAHANLGNALMELERHAEAVECFRTALKHDPQNVNALTALGNALLTQKQFADAAQCFQQALRINPRLANVHIKLAEALKNGQPPPEETPGSSSRKADAHNNLGLALMDDGNAADALKCFEQALKINPRHADAQNNLSNAYLRLGRLKEAWEHNDQALRINPVHGAALWDRSLLHLLHGEFLEGWPDYEQRWALPNVAPRNLHRPRWDGAPLEGKTILLHTEQGLGDTIQFIRYAKLIKACGGNIILGCQPPLVSLMARVPEISSVFTVGAPLPPYDVHAPLLSLPGIFGTTVENLPAQVPYLFADPSRIEHWREKTSTVAVGSPLNVGIAWQGNPKNQIDRYRSLPLENFEPLARIEGVNLISMQVVHGMDQMAEVPFKVIDLGGGFDLGSVEDMAAAIMNMDLMVTSDSAIAHLAGALGVPIFTALGLTPDWRWLLECPDCPWYPTMKLFRQREFGNWREVFERIATAVRTLMV